MTRRWRSTIGYAAAGLVVGGLLVASGSTLAGIIALVVLLGAAVVFSPRAFPPSVTDESARAAQVRDGRPIIYWRPGCPFCLRLRTTLARDARRYHWVDIWSDPAGAASVRAVADGNETVPTVITPDRSLVNPSPRAVKSL